MKLKRILTKIQRILMWAYNIVFFNFLYLQYKRFTMIPRSIFVKNLKISSNFRHINGAVVECGVWRGGMIAAMSKVIGNERNYYLYDSFEGLPRPSEQDGAEAVAWQNDTPISVNKDNCKAEIAFAKKAMEIAGAKKNHFIKGWFKDTLPIQKPAEPIAILRLDGDWYESTMDCLTHLYPLVQEGGVIIFDDYYAWNGCAKAVHDFLSKNNLPHAIRQWDNGVAYIIKKPEGKFISLTNNT